MSQIEIVGAEGSILSVRIDAQIAGRQIRGVLDTDMDGCYAAWQEPAPALEVGGDGWDDLVVLLDADPGFRKAVEDYNS